MDPKTFQETLDSRAQEGKEAKLQEELIQSGKDNAKVIVDTIVAATKELLKVTKPLTAPNITVTAKGIPESVAKLSSEVDKLSKSYSTLDFEAYTKEISSINDRLSAVADALNAAKVDNVDSLENTIKNLNDTLSKVDFKPKVTVQSDRGVNLESYRAQDLDEMEPGVQYVGFLNPEGKWYVVKNVEAENRLRYAFGSSNYADMWPSASKLQFKLLDEALREVQA